MISASLTLSQVLCVRAEEFMNDDNTGQKVVSPFNGSRAYTLNEAETAVLMALRAMKFGSLHVTMHDGRIVQIERTEKMRFSGDGSR